MTAEATGWEAEAAGPARVDGLSAGDAGHDNPWRWRARTKSSRTPHARRAVVNGLLTSSSPAMPSCSATVGTGIDSAKHLSSTCLH